jgi:hypothetical protein
MVELDMARQFMVDLASLVNLPEAHGCPTTELDDRITSCDVLIGEPL